jgi:hypothetical protein
MLLAQLAGYSLIHLLVMVVVIAACVGIVYVALQQFGVQIPRFVVLIFWIVVCAFVAIAAIRFIGSM